MSAYIVNVAPNLDLVSVNNTYQLWSRAGVSAEDFATCFERYKDASVAETACSSGSNLTGADYVGVINQFTVSYK